MAHTGTGSFDAATAVYAAIGLTALAAADLDQDGRADLIIAWVHTMVHLCHVD